MKRSAFRFFGVLLLGLAMSLALACGDDGNEADGDIQADGDSSSSSLDNSCLADLLADTDARNCFVGNMDQDCLDSMDGDNTLITFADGRSLKYICDDETGDTACDIVVRLDRDKCGMIKTFFAADKSLKEFRYIVESSGDSYAVVFEDDGVSITCADDSQEHYSQADIDASNAAAMLELSRAECAQSPDPAVACGSDADCPDDGQQWICIGNYCGALPATQ